MNKTYSREDLRNIALESDPLLPLSRDTPRGGSKQTYWRDNNPSMSATFEWLTGWRHCDWLAFSPAFGPSDLCAFGANPFCGSPEPQKSAGWRRYSKSWAAL